MPAYLTASSLHCLLLFSVCDVFLSVPGHSGDPPFLFDIRSLSLATVDTLQELTTFLLQLVLTEVMGLLFVISWLSCLKCGGTFWPGWVLLSFGKFPSQMLCLSASLLGSFWFTGASPLNCSLMDSRIFCNNKKDCLLRYMSNND